MITMSHYLMILTPVIARSWTRIQGPSLYHPLGTNLMDLRMTTMLPPFLHLKASAPPLEMLLRLTAAPILEVCGIMLVAKSNPQDPSPK